MTRQRDDEGFTLIELLVVMIIVGILAAIAIPVFLSQREKARDTSTRSDLTRLGKEVAAYYVDGTSALTVTGSGTSPVSVTVTAGALTVSTLTMTDGTALQTVPFTSTAGAHATTWCVALTNPAGKQDDFSYSATAGLRPGSCP